jgi:cytochrome c553
MNKLSSLALAFGFAASMVAYSTGCSSAPAAGVERGEYLFGNYCAPCHTPSGLGKPNVAAPAIAGLPLWYVQRQLVNYRTDLRGYHFDDLEGLRMKPMSKTLMSDTDVAIVAEYVSRLPSVQPEPTLDGDAKKGEALYATCKACHQADGQGMEQLNAPPLTNTHDWYLVTQLKKFKGGVRGARDQYGKQMMPMATGLADEQAMKDVVAYVMTLRK